MRFSLIVLACVSLILSGCAKDQYTLVGGVPIADQEIYKSDLKDCKLSVIQKYYDTTPFYERTGFASGLIGGAIGGAVAAGVENKPDLNGQVTSCMTAKGYAGSST